MSEHETYLAVLKAFYDYEPQSEDELAITENQIVFLLERTDDDWWKVKIKGDSQEEDSPSGFVPAAYVQQAQHTSLVRALYGFDSTAPGELSIEENEILMVFDREEGWMLVQSKKEGGKAGFVPGNYVEEVFTSCEEAEEVTQEGGQGACGSEPAVALYDFEGTDSDELTVQEGERLWIIEKEGEEWWKCRNVHDIEGVVPASYLESNGAERGERQEAAKRARQKAERGQSSSTRPSTSRMNPRNSTSSARCSSSDIHKKMPSAKSTRIWHDRSGQFRVEAAFLGCYNGKFRLHKINGLVIEIPSEKMSLEDIRYVERLAAQNTNPPAVQRRHSDNDDQPLALKQTKVTRRATMSAQPKKPQTYWFEFFLNAGCDIDDCTRYASSFKREKIDEAILPDITKSTMRSLGLREGDIIRITKCIQQKFAKPKKDTSQEQLIRDEELARKLQEEEVLLAFMDDRRTREAQVTGRRSPSIDWEAATYPSPPPSNVEIPGIGHVLSSSDPVVDEPPPYVP